MTVNDGVGALLVLFFESTPDDVYFIKQKESPTNW